jgi:hypothetical protein
MPGFFLVHVRSKRTWKLSLLLTNWELVEKIAEGSTIEEEEDDLELLETPEETF